MEAKLEEALKYKYSSEFLKEVVEGKDREIRSAEKDLARITFELEELLKNNPTEELYQLRHAQSHTSKLSEDLQARLSRSEEEITKYKENYVKIETAYQIQSKNYQTAIEKQAQIEAALQAHQRDNYELKNHLAATLRRSEDYELRYNQTQDERQQLAKAHEELSSLYRNTAQQLAAAGGQVEAERAATLRLRAEWEAKQLELEEKVRKLEVSLADSL